MKDKKESLRTSLAASEGDPDCDFLRSAHLQKIIQQTSEKVNKSGTFKRLRVLVIDSNKSKKYINIYNRSKEGHEEKEEGCVYRL